MAHIEWNNGEPIDLGTIQGDIKFTPVEPSPEHAPIEIVHGFELTMTFTVPDDSPLYRLPLIMAANAPNN